MELITIDFDAFRKYYIEIDTETDVDELDDYTHIKKCAEDLKQKFPYLSASTTGRFTSGGGHENHHSEQRSKFHHRRSGPSLGHYQGGRRPERPRIGTRELSREDISRKDFLANLNKLSRQNYESILRLIRTTYNSNFLQNYMDITWEMMLRQVDFQDLHIEVVQHLMNITPPDKKERVTNYWNERCKSYFDNKEWTPPEDIFTTQSSVDEYDDFCDYIKWKKKTGASLLAWLRLMDAGVIPSHYAICFASIMDSIQEALKLQKYKYFDCLLEWFLQMVRFGVDKYPFGDDIVFTLNDWMDTITHYGLSSSLRFKIMDIHDIILPKK